MLSMSKHIPTKNRYQIYSLQGQKTSGLLLNPSNVKKPALRHYQFDLSITAKSCLKLQLN